MSIPDGFDRERMVVVPRPLVTVALGQPVTSKLLVTDAGWFPHASQHGRTRTRGAAETIVLICVAGAGELDIGGATFRITPAVAAIIPAGVPHAYRADEDDPWTIWWLHLRGTDTRDLTAVAAPNPNRPVVSLRSVDRCVALADEALSALEHDLTPPRMLLASGAAWKLLTQVATDRLVPQPHDPLQRAMTYLADRLDSQVRVPELAALVGVSPSHLGALFRHSTGGGVLQHHTALRMARARQLLDGSAVSVQEIAAEVGYVDPFYFSRHFKKMHGVSPQQYRSQRKG